MPNDNPYSCTYTNDTQAIAEILRMIQEMRRNRWPLPKQLEYFEEAGKTAINVEEALNETCAAMTDFMNSVGDRCAKESGFKDYKDMDRQRSIEWSRIDETFEPCVYNSTPRGYDFAYDWGINWNNPQSFIKKFGTKEWEQLKAWLARKARARVSRAVGTKWPSGSGGSSAPNSSPSSTPSSSSGPSISQP